MSNTVIAKYYKDPDVTLDYSVDWTTWLTGDTISDSVWGLENPLTLVSESSTPTGTTAFISGGVNGEAYVVYNRITTAGGRIADFEIDVVVQQRFAPGFAALVPLTGLLVATADVITPDVLPAGALFPTLYLESADTITPTVEATIILTITLVSTTADIITPTLDFSTELAPILSASDADVITPTIPDLLAMPGGGLVVQPGGDPIDTG